MPDPAKEITFYDIAKDVIIPLLGLVTTIVVGTIIAYLLKNKEAKAKVKPLLIDTYMVYLNKKSRFFEHELTVFKYQIFKDIVINFQDYFQPHANDPLVKEKIIKLRDKFKTQLDQSSDDDTNWSPFTYKFAFLLSKRRYSKHVQYWRILLLNTISVIRRVQTLSIS